MSAPFTPSDFAVLMTNLSELINSAIDLLCDVDRSGLDDTSRHDLSRGMSLLMIGSDVARLSVEAYEREERERLKASMKGRAK